MELSDSSRIVRNPFVSLPGYNCFGCSPDNPFGLQLKFIEEEDELVSFWEPKDYFQGYFQVLHGGIQATLMDEIASWIVYIKLKTVGFTSRAELKYHKTVFVNQGSITLRGRNLQMRRNLADIEVKLFNSGSELCTSGLFTYFTYSAEKVRKNLYYPDFQ